jgi:hypothetical protein
MPYLPGLRAEGTRRVGSEVREFLIGVGQRAHNETPFSNRERGISDALPIPDPRLETVEFYKVSKLKVGLPGAKDEPPLSPWRGVPPPLCGVPRARSSATCRANLPREVLELHLGMSDASRDDHNQSNPSRRRYRTETFCYGPRSCRLYRAGPMRTAPGRRPGMIYTEEDWVDDEATPHRLPEE